MSRFTLAVILAAKLLLKSVSADNWVSPEYKYIFQFPLPIPPTIDPVTSYTNATTGKSIDYYEINIEAFEKQTYPDLGNTLYVGYNGIAPGPTFKMKRGREAVVKFINDYDRPSSIHLHGSYSRTPFDGWAEDRTYPGQAKDYYYPNAQPMRTLWYHDHSLGITAVNAYFGQAGFYFLDDPEVDAALKLPTGDYDIPLMLASKQFQANGTLVSPENERTSLFGDVITVNAQPWPYMKAEPRMYKFRVLDASISRSYKLYLVADDNPNVRLPFTVVGADAGYLDHPVDTTSLVIAMAERYEIVVDFGLYQGKNLTLKNELQFQTNTDYPATDRIMKFVVGSTVTSLSNNGPIPSHLSNLNTPGYHPTIDHSFTFERTNGQWLINGIGFEDIPNRILAFPEQGRVQRWELINKSGGWSHPIHIHLIDFQVVSRSGGRGAVEAYEAAALKDVVYLGVNERVEVIANFAPWSGVYMFHCHNLVHEDHDMMAAFNVSQVNLTDYGYPQKVSFIDPMIDIFQAKSYSGPTDLDKIKNERLPYFQGLNAYPDALSIEADLNSYWATHTTTVVASSSTTNGGNTAKTTSASTLVTSTKTTSSTNSTKTSTLSTSTKTK